MFGTKRPFAFEDKRPIDFKNLDEAETEAYSDEEEEEDSSSAADMSDDLTDEADEADDGGEAADADEYEAADEGEEVEARAATARATFHFPLQVPLSNEGLADLQLSYVTGSLALAESELVAMGVDAVLGDVIPKYMAYLQSSVMRDQRAAGVGHMLRILHLLESLVNSVRNLAVGDPLTHWNDAALSVLGAIGTLERRRS